MLAVIADLEAAAAAAAAAAEEAAGEPMPGLSAAEIEVMVSNAAAKAAADALASASAAAAAAAAVDEAFSDAFVEPSKEGSAAAAAAAAAAAQSAADPELDNFLSVVGTSDWDNFLKAVASGGPPNTQITINSTAVSGQEVVDALGGYVDTNGPLPPHWQQSAG